MIDKERILKFLRENLKEKRLNHVMGVVDTSKRLAKIYGVSEEKAEIAALIHDCAKNFSFERNLQILKDNYIHVDETTLYNKELIHSVVAPVIAKEKLNIEDEEILNAARFHTTGRREITTLEKIIYLADAIEPSREYRNIEEIRNKAFSGDLDSALLMSIDGTLEFLIGKGLLIHKDTIEMRNYLLILKGEKYEYEET